MTDSSRHPALGLLPLLFGVLTFFWVIGPQALNPQNIAWLEQGDTATHYLGWAFFRHSPWTFPLGLNPSYGLELGSAIIFSDSNPLLALLFKPFSAWLPPTFQYFGLWLLGCFVLQAWFGWKLLGLITANPWIRLLGTGLLVFSPPLFLRMGWHPSLAGHFLILAALYLALLPNLQRRYLAWGTLLAATALIHAYLLAMVALIWVADLLGQAFSRRLTLRHSLTEGVALFALVSLCCWQAGYFSIADGAASGGFGLYRMNLLAPVDPAGWSLLLPNLPQASGDYEGFNYLGLGVLLLVPPALLAWLGNRQPLKEQMRARRWLVLALLGLWLFALSNQIGIGGWTIHYPLPEKIIGLASIFRASGRMFWPVFYGLILTLIFLVVRGYRPRVAISLLALALLIQIVDTRDGWMGLREGKMTASSSTWNSPMGDPFWTSAAAHYPNVRSLMPQNQAERWQMIAGFAATHGLHTDAVYLGRMSVSALARAQQSARQMLDSGHYGSDSLYILDDDALADAAKTINSDADLLTRVDGLAVLAPGWKRCAACLPMQDEGRSISLIPLTHPGQVLTFNYSSRQLTHGWATPESWGTWSNGRQAQIALRVPPQARGLVIDALAFIQPQHAAQRVIASLNGEPVLSTQLTQLQGNRLELPISPAIRQRLKDDDRLNIELQLPDAISPQALGINDDARLMGLGLKTLTVY
ncbi:DUF6311 domain-containing protein [Pseudomonas sp. B2M1-30]|uniref:DUF6311 domain-containing protein n=1 Tax=Pseudomonas TaxID=286 RepID=UPI0021C883C2|nr:MULTISPECIES: DUF6311 domain-containing protein [Pseudomonas]MCU0120468.1 DUF6311 domain-containing protein [Pseudomonas sp. B2M1-30]MCU7262486.1 DUF6311 domain-containing protein [Pseudomonas koreensis]